MRSAEYHISFSLSSLAFSAIADAIRKEAGAAAIAKTAPIISIAVNIALDHLSFFSYFPFIIRAAENSGGAWFSAFHECKCEREHAKQREITQSYKCSDGRKIQPAIKKSEQSLLISFNNGMPMTSVLFRIWGIWLSLLFCSAFFFFCAYLFLCIYFNINIPACLLT